MANRTPEPAAVGDRLRCARCGTEVRMEQVGSGHVECCDRPLGAASGGVATGSAAGGAHAKCEDCGNEVRIEHDGGGSLSCCHADMIRD